MMLLIGLLLLSLSHQEFMPLAVGNRWVYRFESEGAEEVLVNSITGVKKVGGRDAYVLQSKAERSGTTSSLVFWTEEGLIQADSTAVKFAPSLLELKTPVKPGTEWKWEGTVTIRGASYPATAECKITGSGKLTVPAGTFDVVVVRKEVVVKVGESDIRVVTTDSYARGVGWVKGVLDSAGRRSITELKSYELVK